VVYLTSIFENECHHCMAGPTALAKMQKMDPAVIDALTELPDRKLEALHHFTALVVRNRGWVSDADVDAFLAAGYTPRNVLEVILGVATNVMSNYANHIAYTQLDTFMRGNECQAGGEAGGLHSPALTARRHRSRIGQTI
jgi:alkylhydroperoxidase family enzyme